MISVLVFLAIAIPLLVICLDEKKKKATLAKLRSCRTRISNVRLPSCPRPTCSCSCSCPKLPQRRTRPQPTAPVAASPVPPVAQDPPTVPAPVAGPPFPEPKAPDVEFNKLPLVDELPPPYPGGPGPAYPPANYQEYPPPWSNAAYPPPS